MQALDEGPCKLMSKPLEKCRTPGHRVRGRALRADAYGAMCLTCKAAAQRERCLAAKLARKEPEPRRASKRPRGPPTPMPDTLMGNDMNSILEANYGRQGANIVRARLAEGTSEELERNAAYDA